MLGILKRLHEVAGHPKHVLLLEHGDLYGCTLFSTCFFSAHEFHFDLPTSVMKLLLNYGTLTGY